MASQIATVELGCGTSYASCCSTNCGAHSNCYG